MKKLFLLLFSVVCLSVGAGTIHAQRLDAEAAFTPYPPVLSPALDELPQNTMTIILPMETFYYADGVFYQKLVLDNKYTAVPPPIGAVVFNLPVGYEYMLVDGDAYYVYKNVYYRRVLDGFKVIPPVV